MRSNSYIKIYTNILHIYIGDYIGLLSEQIQKNLFAESKLQNFVKCSKYVIRYIRDWTKGYFSKSLHSSNPSKINDKIWFYANTVNQYRALESIFSLSSENVWVSRNLHIPKQSFAQLMSMNRLGYLFKFPQLYKGLKKENLANSKRSVYQIFEASGQYEFYLKQIKKYKPKAIILSSDHSLTSRSLMLSAKKLAIPIIYIQHATVSSYFPNLEADLNLLEGQHALDSYKKCGPINGEVKFVGMAKFDKYVKLRKKASKIMKIGVCLNPTDDIEIITKLLNFLSNEFSEMTITFRKHPRDGRELSVEHNSILESDSKTQDSFSYLLDQDLLIAGDSSIHLESVLLNIPSIYYSFSGLENLKDYYGFIKEGMISEASNLDQLKDEINRQNSNIEDVYLKAKYYNALVGTESEGKSSMLTAKYISEFLQNKGVQYG